VVELRIRAGKMTVAQVFCLLDRLSERYEAHVERAGETVVKFVPRSGE